MSRIMDCCQLAAFISFPFISVHFLSFLFHFHSFHFLSCPSCFLIISTHINTSAKPKSAVCYYNLIHHIFLNSFKWRRLASKPQPLPTNYPFINHFLELRCTTPNDNIAFGLEMNTIVIVKRLRGKKAYRFGILLSFSG